MHQRRDDERPPREPPILAGRVPPNDLRAEAAVLADVFIHPERADDVILIANPECFYSDQHRLIMSAVRDLRLRRVDVDPIAVHTWLRDRELAQRAGGVRYLDELIRDTPAVVNVEQHAQRVADMYRKRRYIGTFQELAAEGYDVTPDDWTAKATQRVAELGESASTAWNWTTANQLAGELPPIPWVVDGLELAPGLPSMFAGYGYSGKTMAAQVLALSVAMGRRVFGVFDVEQGTVRHVDYEQGSRLTAERYQRIARGMRIDLEEVGDDLGFVSLPRQKLDDASTELLLTRELMGVQLAIFDSFRAGAPTTDENSSESRVPLDMLGRVSEQTGCTCLVIHHARKTNDGDGDKRQILRGSSALFDACQSVWTFSAKKGEPTTVANAKARLTGRAFPEFLLETTDVPNDDNERWGLAIHHEDPDTAATERREKEASRLRDGVIAALKAVGKPCSQARVLREMRGLGIAVRNGRQGDVLADLEEMGKLHSVLNGKQKLWAIK